MKGSVEDKTSFQEITFVLLSEIRSFLCHTFESPHTYSMSSLVISGWHLRLQSSTISKLPPWNWRKVSLFMKWCCNLSISRSEKLHLVDQLDSLHHCPSFYLFWNIKYWMDQFIPFQIIFKEVLSVSIPSPHLLLWCCSQPLIDTLILSVLFSTLWIQPSTFQVWFKLDFLSVDGNMFHTG